MKDFRKPTGGAAGKGSYDRREQYGDRPQRPNNFSDRKGYGTHKGDFNAGDRRETLHQATCATCGKTCEVPFRPNGKKPVYCKDCFNAQKESYSSNNSYEKRDYKPQASQSYQNRDGRENREERSMSQSAPRDTRIDELKTQMTSMQHTLERILKVMETHAAPVHKAAEAKPMAVKTEAAISVPAKKAALAAKKPAKAKPAAKKKK